MHHTRHEGNQVRIGTEAPDDVKILREELLKADTA
ncbi:MAG: carbon storage regulator [Thiogranum sp.]